MINKPQFHLDTRSEMQTLTSAWQCGLREYAAEEDVFQTSFVDLVRKKEKEKTLSAFVETFSKQMQWGSHLHGGNDPGNGRVMNIPCSTSSALWEHHCYLAYQDVKECLAPHCGHNQR